MSTAVSSQPAPASTPAVANAAPKDKWVDNRDAYEKIKKTLKYPAYAPYLDSSYKQEPYVEFEHKDPGHLADKNLKNLFAHGYDTVEAAQGLNASDQLVKYGYSVEHLTPAFGSEVHGIQVSQLDDKGKNDLARFVAERGVVVFQDQDFRDLPIEEAAKWAEYFGPLHTHQTSPAPLGHPYVHLVYRDENEDAELRRSFNEQNRVHVSSVQWHTDISFERQPAGLTFLGALEVPNAGGDTLYLDSEEIYRRLSPEFKKRLEGLEAIHSGVDQANFSLKRGGISRRDPVENAHPIVRTHPITKRNSIYVNPSFTRSIVGYKKEESDALLNFLYDIQAKTQDAQLRVKWKDGTLTFWDNRRTGHSALVDWHDTQRRHLFRFTPQAEIPFGPGSKEAPKEE